MRSAKSFAAVRAATPVNAAYSHRAMLLCSRACSSPRYRRSLISPRSSSARNASGVGATPSRGAMLRKVMTKLKPSSRNSGAGKPQARHLLAHAADARPDLLDVAPLDQHAGDEAVARELVVAEPLERDGRR